MSMAPAPTPLPMDWIPLARFPRANGPPHSSLGRRPRSTDPDSGQGCKPAASSDIRASPRSPPTTDGKGLQPLYSGEIVHLGRCPRLVCGGPLALSMNRASVAAGVPPAVEGGVSPPGIPGSWSQYAIRESWVLSMNRASPRLRTPTPNPNPNRNPPASPPVHGPNTCPISGKPSSP